MRRFLVFLALIGMSVPTIADECGRYVSPKGTLQFAEFNTHGIGWSRPHSVKITTANGVVKKCSYILEDEGGHYVTCPGRKPIELFFEDNAHDSANDQNPDVLTYQGIAWRKSCITIDNPPKDLGPPPPN